MKSNSDFVTTQQPDHQDTAFIPKEVVLDAQVVKSEKSKQKMPMPFWQKAARASIAFFLWCWVFIKLFVFDLDRWLIDSYFPSIRWVLDFKFAFLVASIGIVALFWRMHLLWRWIGYILFFPIVFTTWSIPAFVFKHRSWTLGIALAVLGLNAVRNLRIYALIISGFTLGTILCAFVRTPWLLLLGSLLVLASLLMMYWRSVTCAFRPTLDAFSSNALDTLWDIIRKSFDTNEIAKVPVEEMTEKDRNTWTANLQIAVLYNRACYFFAQQLRDLKRSNMTAITYIFRLVFLFFATAWAFFLFNYALFEADPSSYSITKGATGFDFFYYSFNRLFSNSTGGIDPVTVLSQSLAMAGTIFMGVIFTVVVVFVVTSLKKSRDDAHLEETVSAIQTHALKMEPYINERYGVSVVEAIDALEKMRAGLIGAIYYFSPSFRPPTNDNPDS